MMRIVTGGTILTMESPHPRAEALAIDGDRLVAVGEEAAVRAAAPGAEEVNLEGGCLLPGFIDAHHHFAEGALLTSMLNLHWPAVRDVPDILEALTVRAAETPVGRWIIGEGYDERRLLELRAPTIEELDAACPDHPVLLIQFSYHEVVVNSRAHEVLQLPLCRPDPAGGEIERGRHGRPTGRMIENACAPFYMEAIRDALARDEAGYFEQLARYQDRLFATGITRVYDAAVSPMMQQTLERALDRGVLRMPVLMMLSSADGMFMPPRDRLQGGCAGDGTDLLRSGPLKLFMDGGERLALRLPLHVVAAATFYALGRALRRRTLRPLRAAAMVPMQLDLAGWCVRGGILFYGEAEAHELVAAAVGLGMSVAVHAEGNVAIDRALNVLPRSRADRAPGVGPHRIEHFFLPEPDAMERAAARGLAIATQPTILEWTGDQILAMGMGGRRPFIPLRAMLDAGLVVAGSSDAPVVDFDPLHGVRCAVQRRSAEGERFPDGQEISVREALEMYTVHGARSGGLEQEIGSLRPGKRADLVVLNTDPTTLPPEQLERLRVDRTICGGVDVFVRRP